MLAMLIAYDAAGNVVGTLDYVVARDEDGQVIGLVDFAAHEAAGGEATDIWTCGAASGAKVWPEWIGGRAHEFRVELAGPPGRKHLAALVHKQSGHRRERAAVEAAIATRITAAKGAAADIRDLVGGPLRPLTLDTDGRTVARARVARSTLPVVARLDG